MHSAFHLLLILLIGARTSPLSAATIQTLDGKTHTSQAPIRFEPPSSLLLIPPTGQPVKIELASILSAHFKPADTAPAASLERWKSRDIGTVGAPGASRLLNHTLTVRGSGADIGGREDAFHFVHQPATGNCQITARLVALQKTDPLAKAGLMLRSTITPNSPFVMVAVGPDGTATLLYRKVPGQGVHTRPAGRIELPRFLRLTRTGDEFAVHHSADARQWEPLINDKLTLTPALFAGAAVTSRNNSALATATFERLSLSTGGDAAFRSADPSPQNLRGVLFRNGAFLAGKVRTFNATALRLPPRPGQPEISIPFAEVSRIIFTTPPRSAIDKLFASPGASLLSPAPTRLGVLLSTDDFLEGAITPQDASRLRLSSVLFGLRELQVGHLAVAAFKDPAPTPTLLQIRATDGSLFLTDRLAIDKDHLLLEAPPLGQLRLALTDLLEIRAGPSRFIPLTDLKPVRVTPPSPPATAAYSTSSAAADASLDPDQASHTLTLSAGASVTYRLNAGYRLLSFRLSTPPNRLPASTLHLHISSAGKPLYQSPPITALSEPHPVLLPLDALTELTLSVTSDTPLSPDLLLSDPALIK